MKTSHPLRTLIRACKDDERTLQHERKFVDPVTAETLARLAASVRSSVLDLERLGGSGQEGPNGSWAELAHEATRNLWVMAAGRNTGDAIASCRHSHKRTEARYEEAMQGPWGGEIGQVLAAQRSRLHDEVDELNRLQFGVGEARPNPLA
jgi:hypothetical protein